jgi:CRP/FNR family transcriptional regulator, cyclic AMP receptor protein
MRKDAKLELLRSVPLFSGCTKKELGEIATLADEIALPAGTTLIEEGRLGHEFFALVDGSVEVTANGRSRKKLGAGCFFGEMALVSSRPRNSTVKALTPVRVLVVHESGFRRLLHDSPEIQLKVLRTLADRAAENAQDYTPS